VGGERVAATRTRKAVPLFVVVFPFPLVSSFFLFSIVFTFFFFVEKLEEQWSRRRWLFAAC
jgi:hypothetical protein